MGNGYIGARYEVRGTRCFAHSNGTTVSVCHTPHPAPRTPHLFPTAYAPNTEYLSAIACAKQFGIDIEEPYIRQTFRNHCEILTSQGVQKLSIPIEKKSTQSGMIKDVKIDYSENWQRQHWRSIQTSYSNSPYFLYYQDELKGFYEKRWGFLVDFNFEILSFILKKMNFEKWRQVSGIGCQVSGVGCQVDTQQSTRHLSPVTGYRLPRYQQVFGQTFIPNLSSFDLLFNCGPESKSYLLNF